MKIKYLCRNIDSNEHTRPVCLCVCECRLPSSPLDGISKSQKMRSIKVNNTAAILATRNKKKSSSSRSSLIQEKGFYLSFHPDIIAKHHDETFSSSATVHSVFKDRSGFWWGCLDSLKIASCWSGRRLVPEPAEVNRSWLKLPLDLGHGNDRDTMRSQFNNFVLKDKKPKMFQLSWVPHLAAGGFNDRFALWIESAVLLVERMLPSAQVRKACGCSG